MLCASAVLNIAAFAQSSGTISGTVTDAGGDVIANAKVAARNLTNGELRKTVTNTNRDIQGRQKPTCSSKR